MTPEQKQQRIDEIREAVESFRPASIGSALMRDYAEELLSLVKSEASDEWAAAAAIYYEGLDRIWRLLDLKMREGSTGIAVLQQVAHDYMVRGNEAGRDAILSKAQQLAVDIDGSDDSATELQTLVQAWQIIQGVARNAKSS